MGRIRHFACIAVGAGGLAGSWRRSIEANQERGPVDLAQQLALDGAEVVGEIVGDLGECAGPGDNLGPTMHHRVRAGANAGVLVEPPGAVSGSEPLVEGDIVKTRNSTYLLGKPVFGEK